MRHRILPAIELAARRFGAAVVASALLHGATVEGLTWMAHRRPADSRPPTTVVLTSIIDRARPVPAATATRRARAPEPGRVREARPAPEPAAAPGSLVLDAVEVRPRELRVEAVAAEPLRADLVGPAARSAGALVFLPFAADGAPLRGDELLPPLYDEDEMSPPEYESGPAPEYTPMALERRVEGLVVTRCVVSTAGRVSRCRVVKGLPYMEEAVVRALVASRYRPARREGRPVTVLYDFKVKLVLPK